MSDRHAAAFIQGAVSGAGIALGTYVMYGGAAATVLLAVGLLVFLPLSYYLDVRGGFDDR